MHMNFCLDKTRRLTHNNEYRLVYKHGKYEVGRMCVLYRMPVAKQSTRIGFVTGKKGWLCSGAQTELDAL